MKSLFKKKDLSNNLILLSYDLHAHLIKIHCLSHCSTFFVKLMWIKCQHDPSIL